MVACGMAVRGVAVARVIACDMVACGVAVRGVAVLRIPVTEIILRITGKGNFAARRAKIVSLAGVLGGPLGGGLLHFH